MTLYHGLPQCVITLGAGGLLGSLVIFFCGSGRPSKPACNWGSVHGAELSSQLEIPWNRNPTPGVKASPRPTLLV